MARAKKYRCWEYSPPPSAAREGVATHTKSRGRIVGSTFGARNTLARVMANRGNHMKKAKPHHSWARSGKSRCDTSEVRSTGSTRPATKLPATGRRSAGETCSKSCARKAQRATSATESSKCAGAATQNSTCAARFESSSNSHATSISRINGRLSMLLLTGQYHSLHSFLGHSTWRAHRERRPTPDMTTPMRRTTWNTIWLASSLMKSVFSCTIFHKAASAHTSTGSIMYDIFICFSMLKSSRVISSVFTLYLRSTTVSR
mmetsp:Transcript_42626/g.81398  ORF Transcript_42626/g.81398 Transcript_42626/m.81398 type:complete len:260 (-) Transcript_42626:1106-1885(-)